MITKLLEFKNQKQELLRGIFAASPQSDGKYIVIMFGGFERSGTTEKKFKKLANDLAERDIASFRFDAPDCGLSDGNFYNITIESLAEDLLSAVDFLKTQGYEKFSMVGHSLAACALALTLSKAHFEKIVLIAPALNQRELLRLWFVQKNNKHIEVSWKNYRKYLNEDEFILDAKADMVAKTHKINYKYRYENANIDYSSHYAKISADKVLAIYGSNDDKVPIESQNMDFFNKIIVEKGDHDLEQPGIIEKWLPATVDFLKLS